jgi:hypothetical protein
MSGSGSLCDHFGGLFNFPYAIFKWSILAKVAGIPVIFPSVGVGPLLSPISRLLVRASLDLASYRTVRDVRSHHETVCHEVAERVTDFRLALARQYDDLFGDVIDPCQQAGSVC